VAHPVYSVYGDSRLDSDDVILISVCLAAFTISVLTWAHKHASAIHRSPNSRLSFQV